MSVEGVVGGGGDGDWKEYSGGGEVRAGEPQLQQQLNSREKQRVTTRRMFGGELQPLASSSSDGGDHHPQLLLLNVKSS